MGTLYLINKPHGKNGLKIAKIQAKKDENIKIVFIMNGVYYAIEEDILRKQRQINQKLRPLLLPVILPLHMGKTILKLLLIVLVLK